MRRILVIDDDPDIREAIDGVLTAEEYEVETASSGREGLERLRADPLFDLIVLDLMMPEMNGWEFRDRQQKDPRIAGIPVVLLSASSEADTAAAVLGILKVLHKPLSLVALLAAIDRCAGPSRS